MSNFVLTGHRGLIGSFLLKRLHAEGHKPVSLVDLRGNRNGSDKKDIRDMSKWNVDKKIDIVYHLASFCKIKDCIEDPSKAFEHNVRGTYEVMEFCRKNNVPKIVFTSSTRVLYPEKNPYTASKIYGEELVKSYGIDYVIVRPSTVYGPFNDLTNRLIHRWIDAAINGESLKIFGDEDKTLDFTYVDDFVDALLQASIETNKEFNIGSGQETKLKDVAQFIIDTVGSGRIEYHPAEKLQPQNVVVDTDFPCHTKWKAGIKNNILMMPTFWKM
jgi:UDP-glucose 4-epimerase